MSTSRVNDDAHEGPGRSGDHSTSGDRGTSQDRGTSGDRRTSGDRGTSGVRGGDGDADGRVTAAGRMEPELMRLAAILLVGAIAALLDTTIVNVAIRAIGQDLHAPLGTVQ